MRLGILGGGQLGMFLAKAARRLGIASHIFCPSDDSPAFLVADQVTQANYTDEKALLSFAKDVDLITYEFENIPAKALSLLKVTPHEEALYIAQNRLREKRLMERLAIPVAPYRAVETKQALEEAFHALEKGILKTCELGYDGKGQKLIASTEDFPERIEAPSVFEAFVPFRTEISTLIARKKNGETALFPIAENRHEKGILVESKVPAGVSDALQHQAKEYALRIAEALDLVGLLAVEFFLVEDSLLVNEIAPRPHNSGHWTLDGCATDQFEQQVRALFDLPFGKTDILAPTTMVNLIGQDVEDLAPYFSDPKAKIHLYGKKEVKPGRKMGHVNLVHFSSLTVSSSSR